ncbi:hypothetical protein BG011_008129 [Mortierella polycephala]|uniref:Heat shock factor binding protein 1 n=1 Tax=Mortierella polycephala TaxID=41804 RepID=A0A9P6PPJ1_9FUNG|nr:hypothetical protein BG011_008129 [Mortierella polycephala]
MSTDSINNGSSATTSADTALTSSSPLQPQAQAQTHSLDIPGKPQQQQQQHQQQQQGEDADAHKDVSPHELTLHVEKLLEQINTKFDGVSTQIFSKMDEMSSRIEDLEKSIGGLVQNLDDGPKTASSSEPSPAGAQQ